MHHTIPFSDITVRYFVPPAPLNKYMQNISETESNRSQYQTLRLVTGMQPHLTFNLGEKAIHAADAFAQHFTCRDVVFGGNHTGWCDIELSDRFFVINIDFQPEVFYSLFRVQPQEISNLFIDGIPIQKELRDIHSRLLECRNFEQRVTLLVQWISRKIYAARYSEDHVIDFLKMQLSGYKLPSEKYLEKTTGYSARTLRHKFKLATGFSMSDYAEATKIRSVISDISDGEYEEMMGLVVKYDFHDLAHLSRKVKQYIGLPPTRLSKELLQGSYFEDAAWYLL